MKIFFCTIAYFLSPKASEEIIQSESESCRAPAELYPYLTNVGDVYEGKTMIWYNRRMDPSQMCADFRLQMELPLRAYPACRLWPFSVESFNRASVSGSSTNSTLLLQRWRSSSPGATSLCAATSEAFFFFWSLDLPLFKFYYYYYYYSGLGSAWMWAGDLTFSEIRLCWP